MRRAQLQILELLLNSWEAPNYIYAFEKGKSIPSMAELHVGQKEVISVDIKDFFPSIKQDRLNTLLLGAGIGAPAARTLSELCTYKAYVPQGALTSPKLSNMVVAHSFGPELEAYCDEHGITLSIYADDLTLSHSKTFDTKEQGFAYSNSIVKFIYELLAKHGFRANKAKTKVMRYHRRQWVCGTVVNSRVNLCKTERRMLRAVVHNCTKYGIEEEAKKSNLDPKAFVRKYLGRINWFGQLNPERAVILKEELLAAVANSQSLSSEPLDPSKISWDSGIEDLEIEEVLTATLEE